MRSAATGDDGQGLRVLARFAGPQGEIRVLEEAATGARHYEEGGITQSRVLPGGEAGVEYVRLMAGLLAGCNRVLLLGCGGGALATMLHRLGSEVTVVEANPLSFKLARTFFWMPAGIECIAADMREIAAPPAGTVGGIGIDVGGPQFSYEGVITAAAIARLRGALREGGRIAVNISLEAPDDPIPGRIADRLAAAGLEVWAFTEPPRSDELNVVLLATAGQEKPAALVRIAGDTWSLARLAAGDGRSCAGRSA
jgi:hypothetical protein